MAEQLIKFFVVFLFVVEPVSLIPLFNGLMDGASPAYKHKMAVKAVTIAGLIILPFAFGGAEFLRLLGISLAAFRIFGGVCCSF
jgi:multiple antibiotic resistance protein